MAYRDEVLADGPVGYWRLGEAGGTTATDASASANHGTYQGAGTQTLLGQRGALGGDADTAVSLLAGGSGVLVPDSASFDLTSFTLECWFNTNGPGSGQRRLVGQGATGGANWALCTNSNQILFLSALDAVSYGVNTSVTANTWHHYAVTLNRATQTITVYKDGNVLGTTACGATGTTAIATGVGIGCAPDGTEQVAGLLDEVAVYPTALSAARVKAHYAAGQPYAGAVMADAPVGYWRLGETGFTVLDTSGNARSGSHAVSVTTSTTQPGGVTGDNAAPFDGATEFVSVAHNAAFNLTGDLTVEAWASLTTYANYAFLVTKDTSNGAAANTFEMRVTPSGGLEFLQYTASGTQSVASPAGQVPRQMWCHFVATKAGTAVTLYVNGRQVQTGTISATGVTTNTLAVLLGTRDDRYSYVTGAMDEVALYATALPAARVQAHYNAGFTPAPAGNGYSAAVLADAPTGYWRLSDLPGTGITDASGSNRHGCYAGLYSGHAFQQATLPLGGSSHGMTNANGNTTGPWGNLGVNPAYSQPTAFSLEAWVYVPSGSANTASTILGCHNNANGGYGLLLLNIGATFQFECRVKDAQFVDSARTYALDAWHHLVATYDGTTYRLYGDGVADTSAAATQTPGTNDTNTPMMLGGLAIGWGGPAGFNGRVDEVAFYPTVLSATRVLAHYQAGQPPKASTLTDTFDDNSLDATKWAASANAGTAVQEVNQRIELDLNDGGTGYCGVSSQALYDLTGSSLVVQCLDPGTGGTGRTAALEAALDGNNVARLVCDGTTLCAQVTVAGAVTTYNTTPFTASTDWWRMTESGGTLSWWYSATGQVGSWTLLDSRASPFSLAVVQLRLFAGTYTGGITAGVAKFDNFNLPAPSALPASDVSIGGWSTETGGTTNLSASIDEPDTAISDADYDQSSVGPANDAYEATLGALTDPLTSGGHVVLVRGLVDAAPTASLQTELRQGANALSTPALWTDTATTTATTFSHPLTGAQADAITDYTGLRLRFTANQAVPAPTFVAAGAFVSTSTNAATLAPGLPAGWAANDIHVLVAARKDTTAMTALAGWTQVANLTGNNSTALRTEVWWRRAVAGDTAPTVTFGSSTVLRSAQILGIRGVPTGASSPFAPMSGGGDSVGRSVNASSTTCTFPGLTIQGTAVTLFVVAFTCASGPTTASQPSQYGTVTVNRSGNNGIAQGYAIGTSPYTGVSGVNSTLSQAGNNDGLTMAFAYPTGSRTRVTWAALGLSVPVVLTPAGIPTAEAIGTASLPAVLGPVAVPTAEALGAPSLALGPVTLSPAGVATGEASGLAVVTAGPAAVSAAGAIASPGALGTPALTIQQVLSPAGVATAEGSGAPVVTVGPVTVSGVGIVSAAAPGVPTLQPGPVGISAAGAIGTGEASGLAVLSNVATLAPTGIATTGVPGTPALTVGPVTLTATGIATAEGPGVPLVAPAGVVQVAPPGIATAGALGTPVLATGPVAVSAAGAVASAGALGAPTVGLGSALWPSAAVQRWTGSAWAPATVRRWDGSAWQVTVVTRKS